MQPVRLITFDATGTLLQFRGKPLLQYAKTASEYGIQANPKALLDKFKAAVTEQSANFPNFGQQQIGYQKWWEEVVLKTFDEQVKSNVDKEKIKKIAQKLIMEFETKAAWTLAPGAHDLLAFLKLKHLKLGIISNFDPRIHKIMEQLEAKTYFNFILSSYEVGFEKPDRKIFDEALKQAQEANTGALHVGDNFVNDYKGATAAGWRAFLVTETPPQTIDRSHVFPSMPKLQEHLATII